MKLLRKVGATSEIWQIFIADSSSTTGAGLTGLVFNSGSLTAYYHRDTDTTATAITLVTMTSGTFTSSGFKEIDSTNMPGWYQFCPPNAALASGAKSCGFLLKGAANMAPLPIEVQLTGYDSDDAVRLGLSSLPNAAAGANGGLPILSVSGTTLGYTISNVTNLTNLPAITAGWLTAAGINADAGINVLNGTVSSATSTTVTFGSEASATNQRYRLQRVTITGGTGFGQSQLIKTYTGGAKTATVVPGWTVTPDNTSTYVIQPCGPSGVELWNLNQVPTPTNPGVPQVDVYDVLGSGISASGGIINVNAQTVGGGGITNASFATDAIDSNALAASATTEIATAVGGTAVPGSFGAGTLGHIIGTGIPDIAPGGINGLLKAGSNADTTFTGVGVSGIVLITGAFTASNASNNINLGSTENAAIATAWGASVVGNSRTRDYFLQGGTNKIAFDVPGGGQYTIYAADDSTVLKVGTYTASGSANPVITLDPN